MRPDQLGAEHLEVGFDGGAGGGTVDVLRRQFPKWGQPRTKAIVP